MREGQTMCMLAGRYLHDDRGRRLCNLILDPDVASRDLLDCVDVLHGTDFDPSSFIIPSTVDLPQGCKR